uniref:Putative secreted protein n=1 Tax=Rhipicephalus microplus TaxID=6941 RepID=A0A6G5A525_RHIMP
MTLVASSIQGVLSIFIQGWASWLRCVLQMAAYSNMKHKLQLKALLLTWFVLHAAQAGSINDIIYRHYHHPMICDRLQAGIRQCLEVMSGIESNYFKNEYLNEGNHDQLMGCVMRELSERHTIRICKGDNSLKMLTGCMASSLKDHVIILFRWRVAAFVKKNGDVSRQI